MTRAQTRGLSRSSSEAMCYPPDLLSDIQITLGALADIEFRFEQARNDILACGCSDDGRDAELLRLKESRRRERAVLEIELLRLQDRLSRIVMQDLQSLN